MNNVNVLDASMKLNIFYENDYVFIILKDYNNFEIQIIKPKKLIEKNL